MTQLAVAEIAARLNVRIADLARALLGEPNRKLSTATQLRFGTNGSVAVEINGPNAGKWFDHEHGVGGDGLEMVRHHLGRSNDEACDWARDWLGLPPHAARSEKCDKPAKSLAEKIEEIVARSEGIAGTRVQAYLQRRGITVEPPDCIRFRRFAAGQFGALVALATDAEGAVLATQQIYLTEDGKKAAVDVVKRTNKAVDNWSERAAVRLPGAPPLILCEGVETALSIWQATGRATWACLGITNIGRAPVPAGAEVVIARDGDPSGSKADRQVATITEKLLERTHAVSIAAPPEGKDFNDVLVEHGPDAVRDLIDRAESVSQNFYPTRKVRLQIGSDVEIARRVREDLTKRFGRIVYAEGAFWRYAQTYWEDIPDHELRRATQTPDYPRRS
jgi:phage/plasmid primase-like uncharacterized protein